MLLRVVANNSVPTFLLLLDRRSVAQQCWIRLHSSSNIVGATHAHYVWITKTYGLHSSHDALQDPNLMGVVLHTTADTHTTTPNIVGATVLGVVAPVCTHPQKTGFIPQGRKILLKMKNGSEMFTSGNAVL